MPLPTVNLPSGQEWLTSRAREVGATPIGLCHGGSGIAIIYIILEMMDEICYPTLELISNIPVDEFKNTINRGQEKRAELVREAKKFALQQLGISEKDLNESQRQQFTKIKQLHLDNSVKNLNQLEQSIFDIFAILFAIDIIHNPHGFTYLFAKYSGQNIMQALPFIQPKKLKMIGVVQPKNADFLSSCTKTEIKTYFKILYEKFNSSADQFSHPIAIMLIFDTYHTITLGFSKNINEQNGWRYVDFNNLSINFLDKENIHKAILLSSMQVIHRYKMVDFPTIADDDNIFSTINWISFTCSIYVAKKDKKALHKITTMLRNDEEWNQINQISEKVKMQNFDKENFLFFAVKENRLDEAIELIENGADVNFRQQITDLTPLYIAAYKGLLTMTRLLIECGANVNLLLNVKSFGTVSPLLAASAFGQFEVVSLLLKCGADKNLAKNNGANSLHLATMRGNIETVKLLLHYHAPVNCATNDGETSLQLAKMYGYDAIAQLLFDEVKKTFSAQICQKIDIFLNRPRSFTFSYISFWFQNFDKEKIRAEIYKKSLASNDFSYEQKLLIASTLLEFSENMQLKKDVGCVFSEKESAAIAAVRDYVRMSFDFDNHPENKFAVDEMIKQIANFVENANDKNLQLPKSIFIPPVEIAIIHKHIHIN